MTTRSALAKKALNELPSRVEKLRSQIAAVDETMTLHEIQVDPETIKPVRKRKPRLRPYGHLARVILNHLRDTEGLQSTTLVTIAVACNAICAGILRIGAGAPLLSLRGMLTRPAGPRLAAVVG